MALYKTLMITSFLGPKMRSKLVLVDASLIKVSGGVSKININNSISFFVLGKGFCHLWVQN